MKATAKKAAAKKTLDEAKKIDRPTWRKVFNTMAKGIAEGIFPAFIDAVRKIVREELVASKSGDRHNLEALREIVDETPRIVDLRTIGDRLGHIESRLELIELRLRETGHEDQVA